jgi:hypothetical protein
MKIIIDEIPVSKNIYTNQHWMLRSEYKERIAWLIYEQTYTRTKPDFEKATITFDIYFKTKVRHDIANYLGGGLIAWLDCLVDLHFIADDSYEVIGQPIVKFNYDKEKPRTEIIIERRE